MWELLAEAVTNQTYAQPLENLLLFFLHLYQEQEMAELAALSIFQLSAGRATLFQEVFFHWLSLML